MLADRAVLRLSLHQTPVWRRRRVISLDLGGLSWPIPPLMRALAQCHRTRLTLSSISTVPGHVATTRG